MDKKILESYQSYKRMIERNNKKIEAEKFKDIPAVQGKVQSSMKDFPYIGSHVSVQMDEPKEAEKRRAKIEQLEQENSHAKEQMDKIERFINGIRDVKVKEIFTYKYIDGRKVKDVAKVVGYTHGRVSQIISNYLKD